MLGSWRRGPGGDGVVGTVGAMNDIVVADLDDPRIIGFIGDHLRDLGPTGPEDSQHALGVERLRAPGVRVWAATDGVVVTGTVALAPLTDHHEELKGMRTDPERRGEGIAAALLRYALADANGRGVERVSLETGTADFFAPARNLYLRFGFRECGPFGVYGEDPHSLYMTVETAGTPDQIG